MTDGWESGHGNNVAGQGLARAGDGVGGGWARGEKKLKKVGGGGDG